MDKAEERAFERCPKSDYAINEMRNERRRAVFIEGYHQAEKDLDISWVKEVSGVKDMSRAKEEALKAYPPLSIAANYDTINRRDAFEYGYLKAEKDLELSWEDIKTIDKLLNQCVDYSNPYQEVLKRFKERKEK